MAAHPLSLRLGRQLSVLQIAASCCQQVGGFVVVWTALQRSGLASVSTLASALSVSALVLLGMPLSRRIDLVPRRLALWWLAGPLLLCQLGMLALVSQPGTGVLWWLVALQAIIELLGVLVASAAVSYAKLLLTEAQALPVSAWLSTLRQATWIVAQAVGAGLVALGGARLGLLGALAFGLLLAGVLPGLPAADPAPSSGAGGLRGLLRVPGLAAVSAFNLAWSLSAAPVWASQVALMHQVAGMSSGQIGAANLAAGAGAVGAGVLLHRLTGRPGAARALWWLAGLWSAAVAVYLLGAQAGWLLVVLGGWGLVMMANASMAGLLSAARMHLVPADLVAQGQSLSSVLNLGGFLGGGLLATPLVAWWGPSWVCAGSAGLLLCLALPGWWLGRRLG